MDFHLSLPSTPQAARAARRAVSQVLEKWSLTGPLDDLLLIVSELVTNAFRYGHDPVTLHLVVKDGFAVVAVTDGDTTSLPVPQDASETEPTGRGLKLISATASQWGWQRQDDMKVVWAQIPLAG